FELRRETFREAHFGDRVRTSRLLVRTATSGQGRLGLHQLRDHELVIERGRFARHFVAFAGLDQRRLRREQLALDPPAGEERDRHAEGHGPVGKVESPVVLQQRALRRVGESLVRTRQRDGRQALTTRDLHLAFLHPHGFVRLLDWYPHRDGGVRLYRQHLG